MISPCDENTSHHNNGVLAKLWLFDVQIAKSDGHESTASEVCFTAAVRIYSEN